MRNSLNHLLFLMCFLVTSCTTTLNGAYYFDKRSHWARNLTTDSERTLIMNEVRPLAETVLKCDQLHKISLDDYNTHEDDFRSGWTETWQFFGCEKATYFTVQYFKEKKPEGKFLSYRLLNGAACTGELRYIDGYKCIQADSFYRARPELRERKNLSV